MNEASLHNALLFSIEKNVYPYKYRLYFAVSGANGQGPVMRRFYVRSKKEFEAFKIGCLYDISFSDLRLTSSRFLSEADVTNADYLELIRLRDIAFMDERSKKEYSVMSPRYNPAEHYYSYGVYRELMDYKPNFSKKLAINALKLFFYLLSFFIPVGLYLLAVYFFSVSRTDIPGGFLSALTVPLASIMIIPFIVWMMCALNALLNLLLLNFDYARPYLLKQFTMKWSGMRKSCFLEDDLKRQFVKTGIIFISIALIGILLMVLL